MSDREQTSEVSRLISDMNRRISSLQQILGQILQQNQQQQLRLSQSGASEEAHSEHMVALERSVAPITRDLNDFQSRKRIYEKRIRREQSDVIPIAYLFGHVYLDTSDEQQARSIYAEFTRFVTDLGVNVVAEDLPVIGSWIRNILVGIDRNLVTHDFEEKLREVERGFRPAYIGVPQSNVGRNHASAASQLLQVCKDIPQCVFQISSLILVKYVDTGSQTLTVCQSLDNNKMTFLRDDPSLLNKPRKLVESLRPREQIINISH